MENLFAAEFILIGLLIGFFVVAVATSMKPRRSDTVALDSKTKREIQQIVEEALSRQELDTKQLQAMMEKVVASKVEEALSKVSIAAPAAGGEAKKAEAGAAKAPAAEAPAPQPQPAGADGQIPMRVHLGGEVYDIMVNPGENMLDAALDRNVDLDFSCREGNCDTCQVTVLKGREFLNDITPEERDMLDEDQLQAGERLSCMVILRGGGPVEIKQG